MTTIADAVATLEQIAPLGLAEDWDNVGLLAGDREKPLRRGLVCLTLTPDVAQEAIDTRCDLVVTHHPLPFRPIQTLTTETTTGETLWRLAGAGVAVYSAHTAYDSAVGGVNDQLAQALGLSEIKPFEPAEPDLAGGVGRVGASAARTTIGDLVAIGENRLGASNTRLVGKPGEQAGRVAVACGSGGSLLERARRAGCDTFVTGEASFHDCLAARSAGVRLVLLGHFASEHFAMLSLADRLSEAFPAAPFAVSEVECDPLQIG